LGNNDGRRGGEFGGAAGKGRQQQQRAGKHQGADGKPRQHESVPMRMGATGLRAQFGQSLIAGVLNKKPRQAFHCEG
jgi:hypothetical protein